MKSGKTIIPGAPNFASVPRIASVPCIAGVPGIASALLVAGATLAAVFLFGVSPVRAQVTTWQTYRCADGSEFIVGFFGYDKRAHMQVDGKAVTLEKRVALTGSRYSGSGVTLRVTKSGTTFKIGKRPVTACQLT